jgi:hypothetical protein
MQISSNRALKSHWHYECWTWGMHRTSWLHTFAVNILLVAVIAKLRSIIAKHVPLGYQDEGGFHFGVKQTRDNWPAIW